MTEIMTSCPNCFTKIDAVLNPENISGPTVNICSTCKFLLVIQDDKIRKMTFTEVVRHYSHLKALIKIEATEDLIFKIAWVKRALIKMQREISVLN